MNSCAIHMEVIFNYVLDDLQLFWRQHGKFYIIVMEAKFMKNNKRYNSYLCTKRFTLVLLTGFDPRIQ